MLHNTLERRKMHVQALYRLNIILQSTFKPAQSVTSAVGRPQAYANADKAGLNSCMYRKTLTQSL